MCLAVPGKLVKVQRSEPPFIEGTVEFAGVRRKVSLACVPEAREGDYVLVHAGVAIACIDEVEAGKVLEALQAMDLGDELGELQQEHELFSREQ